MSGGGNDFDATLSQTLMLEFTPNQYLIFFYKAGFSILSCPESFVMSSFDDVLYTFIWVTVNSRSRLVSEFNDLDNPKRFPSEVDSLPDHAIVPQHPWARRHGQSHTVD